ncbi:MAG TPA: diguanylate cyclase [Stellaceae bacterium]|nr:diguanylate cyclase [Stellaceae bacterium]
MNGRGSAGAFALADTACEAFAGAAVVLDRGGNALPANARGAALIAGGGAEWQRILAEARTAFARDAAMPGWTRQSGAALLLPLADGERVLLLLPERGADAQAQGRDYKDLAEMAGDFTWEVDRAGRFVFVPPQGALGWPAEALLGRPAAEFVADAVQARLFVANEPIAEHEVWFRQGDGGSACLGLTAMPVHDAAGNWLGARGIARDVSHKRERERILARTQRRERLLTQIVRAIRDEAEAQATLGAALAVTGLLIGAGGACMLRRGAGEGPTKVAVAWGAKPAPAILAGARAALAQAQDDAVALATSGYQLIAHAARYRRAIEGAIVLWRRGDEAPFTETDRALLAEVADHLGVVIAQIETQERIATLSRTDALTGLLNRRAFFDDLARRVARLDRAEQRAVLIYIEVMNLRLVNERHGPIAGDQTLEQLAGLLREHTRAGDLVGRYGGSEFALWIEGIDLTAAASRAEALTAACRPLAGATGDPARPFAIAIGLAGFDAQQAETPATLIARAGLAAAEAKRQAASGAPVSRSA